MYERKTRDCWNLFVKKGSNYVLQETVYSWRQAKEEQLKYPKGFLVIKKGREALKER